MREPVPQVWYEVYPLNENGVEYVYNGSSLYDAWNRRIHKRLTTLGDVFRYINEVMAKGIALGPASWPIFPPGLRIEVLVNGNRVDVAEADIVR